MLILCREKGYPHFELSNSYSARPLGLVVRPCAGFEKINKFVMAVFHNERENYEKKS